MALVEVEKAEREERAAVIPGSPGELGSHATSDAPPDDGISKTIQRGKPKLETSRQLATRLGLWFALLIGILVGLGYWVSHRAISADLVLESALARQTAKLQLTSQALRYSSENSRITMQILVQKSATPDLLARRAGNTQEITALVRALEAQCDSDKERQLLAAIKEAREPYVSSYLRALKLVLEGRNYAAADAIMLQQTTPALFAYHAAWRELEWFEMEQVKKAAEQRTASSRASRHIGLTLLGLAVFLVAVVAVFTITRMVRDIKLRTLLQEKLSLLNAELEHRVAKRTAELARTESQLRESLAQSRNYAQDIARLNESANLLQSCLSLDEVWQQISLVLQQFFPAGAVLVLNPSRNLLDVRLSWGDSSTTEGPFNVESCRALRKGQIHLARRDSLSVPCPHTGPSSCGTHLCVPLVAQGDALGVLCIDDPALCDCTMSGPAMEHKIKQATALGQQISLAVANLMLRDTLKYQSVRDPLTGLFNRRHMEEALERELCRAARKATPVTVLMVDIDHFKRFNDTFGHEAGDLLLRELGSLLQSQVRGGDVACRYGGEEFLLILAETDLELGCQRAETLRQQVAALQIHHHGEMLRRITVSVGVAAFPTHGESAARVISAADQALYQAKREGRDRVVMAK